MGTAFCVSHHIQDTSKFHPKNVDVSIEIYLSVLEEKLLSIQVKGSIFRNLSKSEQEALSKLRSDNSIVIKLADKGSGVVVWDREDYLREAERQLSNGEVYQEYQKDPLPAPSEQFLMCLRTLKAKAKSRKKKNRANISEIFL